MDGLDLDRSSGVYVWFLASIYCVCCCIGLTGEVLCGCLYEDSISFGIDCAAAGAYDDIALDFILNYEISLFPPWIWGDMVI